jgi:FkbH-like protein
MITRWVLLSNTTIAPLAASLKAGLAVLAGGAEVTCHEHGECFRRILDPESDLYQKGADMAVLHLDLAELQPSFDAIAVFGTVEEKMSLPRECAEQVATLARALRVGLRAPLLVSTFSAPPRSPLGIGADPARRRAMREANLALGEALQSLPDSHAIDLDALWREAGEADRDRRFEDIAQFPYGPRMQGLLVGEWLRHYRALHGLSRKCVVLDLDNTLWGGVLGEDGADGIHLGNHPAGRAFHRFQSALKLLRRRGILLAVASKNNADDILPILRSHPDMVLREEDFASIQANWQDKGTQIATILRELKIAPHHLVFLDDNPSERLLVRRMHPEVLVPEMPADPALFADLLSGCELDTLQFTREDALRTEMIRADRQRDTLQQKAPSLEEFLRELQIEVTLQPLSPALLERAAQLCQRTNQFNLTSVRHSLDDLRRITTSPRHRSFMARVRDRFGDHGWTGLVILALEGDLAIVDTLLLSCRVLGKDVELVLFDAAVATVREAGARKLRGVWHPTAKNAPCADYYGKCGMSPVETTTAVERVWETTLDGLLSRAPVYIKVVSLTQGEASES